MAPYNPRAQITEGGVTKSVLAFDAYRYIDEGSTSASVRTLNDLNFTAKATVSASDVNDSNGDLFVFDNAQDRGVNVLQFEIAASDFVNAIDYDDAANSIFAQGGGDETGASITEPAYGSINLKALSPSYKYIKIGEKLSTTITMKMSDMLNVTGNGLGDGAGNDNYKLALMYAYDEHIHTTDGGGDEYKISGNGLTLAVGKDILTAAWEAVRDAETGGIPTTSGLEGVLRQDAEEMKFIFCVFDKSPISDAAGVSDAEETYLDTHMYWSVAPENDGSMALSMQMIDGVHQDVQLQVAVEQNADTAQGALGKLVGTVESDGTTVPPAVGDTTHPTAPGSLSADNLVDDSTFESLAGTVVWATAPQINSAVMSAEAVTQLVTQQTDVVGVGSSSQGRAAVLTEVRTQMLAKMGPTNDFKGIFNKIDVSANSDYDQVTIQVDLPVKGGNEGASTNVSVSAAFDTLIAFAT